MSRALYVVRGGGLAGWGAAALLAESLPATARIVVTDADATPTPSSVDIAALPSDATLLRLCGMPLDRLIADTRADVWLATAFLGWSGGRTVYHAPQEPMPTIDGIALHYLALRAAMGAGRAADYARFHAPLRFQARAAEMGRYAPPSSDRSSPRSLLRPGVMLDGQALVTRLRDRALAAGVIAGVATDDDAVLMVDTRPQASNWTGLPDGTGHDRCVTLRLTGPAAPDTCLRVAPLEAGLMTVLPAGDGLIAALTCGAGTDAEAAVLRALPGYTVADRAEADFAPGFTAQPWQGNRLLLGDSAARLGPVMGLDVALLDRQLAMLADLLPATPAQTPACAHAYTARFVEMVGHHADLLHLVLRHRPGAADPPAPSATLNRRLDQFLSRNRAVELDGDPFDKQVWLDLMIALGLTPRRYDPQADRLAPAAANAQLGRMVQAFDQTLGAMPVYTR